MRVNRSHLREALSKECGLSHRAAAAAVAAFLRSIRQGLESEGQVRIRNFGGFSVVTGARRKTVRFRPARKLKGIVDTVPWESVDPLLEHLRLSLECTTQVEEVLSAHCAWLESGAPPGERPGGLAGADFKGADLFGANLKFAKLTGATMARADLSDADLESADLKGADLTGASLAWANLKRRGLVGRVPERGRPAVGRPQEGKPQQRRPGGRESLWGRFKRCDLRRGRVRRREAGKHDSGEKRRPSTRSNRTGETEAWALRRDRVCDRCLRPTRSSRSWCHGDIWLQNAICDHLSAGFKFVPVVWRAL